VFHIGLAHIFNLNLMIGK